MRLASRPNSMFPSAVRHGKSAYCWKTIPRSRPGPETGTPSTRMRPLLGLVSPPRRSSRVDLPHPLGPTRTRNSPLRISRSTSEIAVNSLLVPRGRVSARMVKFFVTRWNSIVLTCIPPRGGTRWFPAHSVPGTTVYRRGQEPVAARNGLNSLVKRSVSATSFFNSPRSRRKSIQRLNSASWMRPPCPATP